MRRLNSLDGLRGLAALIVVFSHVKILFLAQALSDLPPLVSYLLHPLAQVDGSLPVAVFAILSGFVLSLRFHSEDRTDQSQAHLLWSALSRYPRLALPVAVSVAATWILYQTNNMGQLSLAKLLGPNAQSAVSAFPPGDLSIASAIRCALWESFFAFTNKNMPNPVLWYMELELQGSLFVFGTLALFGKHPARPILYGLTGAWLLILRAPGFFLFLLGAVLCDFYVHFGEMGWVRSKLNWVTPRAASIVSCLLVPLAAVPLHSSTWIFSVAFFWVVFALVPNPFSKILSKGFLLKVGKISFYLYLVHWPVCCALGFPTYKMFISVFPLGIALSLTVAVCIAASLVVAKLFAAGARKFRSILECRGYSKRGFIAPLMAEF
jgi:peptidoglycan/LPS O-acetylase OafA/YrhL